MSEEEPLAEEAERAADGLCEVTWAIEAVDYNALLEEDLQRLISVRQTVQELCLSYRQTQHNAERSEADRDATADTEGEP